MIEVTPSPTADSRTCDFKDVSKKVLLDSSRLHIIDVTSGLGFFAEQLLQAAKNHDKDKITDINGFYADFQTGFEEPNPWWDRHRKLNRHHLTHEDGIPDGVNLIDVLDFITDCVMAGTARSGEVYPLQLPPELLERAFQNTVELLKKNVRRVEP